MNVRGRRIEARVGVSGAIKLACRVVTYFFPFVNLSNSLPPHAVTYDRE